MAPAHRARTSLALGAATAATIVAVLLGPRAAPPPACHLPAGGDTLSAHFASRAIVAGEQDIAVTFAMPATGSFTRPPVSLAIVIDRSGSMTGTPLADAKAAAAHLVEQLVAGDAFSIITYSSGAETVMPMTRATAEGKAAARAAIDEIWDDGNTCISCGLERAASELVTTPIAGGVRRIVLVSDGQANTGVASRPLLVRLATETAARGISITTVGVGLDFDDVTLRSLADVGHGHYHFAEDTGQLAAVFSRELADLGATVATEARLVIEPLPGVTIDEAYGYAMVGQGGQHVVPLADVRAGDTHTVVLRATIAGDPGPRHVARISLHWRQVAGGAYASAHTTLSTVIATDARVAAATRTPAVARAIARARTAKMLEDAATIYERDGHAAAERVLRRHVRDVRARRDLDAETLRAIEAASDDAIVQFATPPAKATKAARASAYQLAR